MKPKTRYADCHPERKHFCKGWCKSCHAKKVYAASPLVREKVATACREWKGRNPDRARALHLRYHLKSKHGMTVDAYMAMLDQQNGQCAICFNPPKTGRRLVVDHCHVQGHIRGLLCQPCNSAIGYLRDNPDTAMSAFAYLITR